ncbi:MAG: aminopeptidase P family protein [Pyrinomonadaceae bacterium]
MKRHFIVLSLLLLLSTVAVPARAGDVPRGVRVTPPAPVFTDAERQAELARRRAAVAEKMSAGSVMILFSAEPKLYTNDVDYVFRQENNLYYLSGFPQQGATLVIRKGTGGDVSYTLYIRKRNPQYETWNGRMISNEEAATISGIKTIANTADLAPMLDGLKARSDASVQTLYLLLPATDGDEDGKREFRQESDFARSLAGYKIVNAQPIFADLRHIKSPYELKVLQHAIDISIEAHMRSMALANQAKMEYEVQAEVEYTFRRRNADFWGYPSIVGCGPNATTLHYQEPQGPVKDGSLLLMDVGAEYDHYTADVTRTFPVNGKFTKEQADIYRIVYDAQEAAARATKPGATMQQISAAADAVIKDGLFRLGLITNKDSNQFKIWYMHGLGHWLGMNVHDVGRYGRPFEPGMVFTNEPGIYIREDALSYLPDTPEWKEFVAKVRPAFEKYKTIGVRIEDDMLVTPNGVEWMTKALPRKLEDVEAFIASARK